MNNLSLCHWKLIFAAPARMDRRTVSLGRNATRTLLVLLLTVFIGTIAEAQSAKRRKAFDLLDKDQVEEAQELYLELMEEEGDDPLVSFETGIAFYRGNSDDQVKAIKFFERARDLSDKNDTIRELFYYLGRTLQYDHRCDEALHSYNSFIPYIRNNQAGRDLKTEVEDYIKMCQHCIYHQELNEVNPLIKYERRDDQHYYYVSEDEYYLLENLGNRINSSHADYASIFFDKEDIMLFTSRRHEYETDQKYDDGKFFEDIYLSRWRENYWEDPVEIDHSNLFASDFISHHLHDATVSAAPNEDHMYLYQDHKIWVSDRENSIWAAPKLLDERFNEKDARVSSAFLAEDENMLVIASDRPGGFGEHDLYYSMRGDDGSWGELQNMGAFVNTEKDEESPYLVPTMDTLYFSSRGHSSIGGYDVFYSVKKEDGTWGTPVNLGIPINTTNDELHYLHSRKDPRFAYYSSDRVGGYGEFDIYRISKNLVISEGVELEMKNIIYVDSIFTEVEMRRGKEYTDQIAKLYEDGKITLDEIILENLTGAYDILPEEERAQMDSVYRDKVEQQRLDSQLVAGTNKPTLTDSAGVNEAFGKEGGGGGTSGGGTAGSGGSGGGGVGADGQPTDFGPCADQVANRDVYSSIYFGFNEIVITQEQRDKLEALADFMKQNENYIIDLSGHTDERGPEDVNIEFSRRRALVVYDFLTQEAKIDPKRIKYHFYGESKPIASNDNDPCLAANRRVDVEVRKTLFYRHINYGIASHYLTDEGIETLREAVNFYQQNTDKTIILRGYTDITGAVAYNRALSRRRVEGAMKYLMGKGVPADKIKFEYFGVENPVSPNTTEETRQFNRRVEVLVDDVSGATE